MLYFFGGGYTIPGNSGDFEFAQDIANQSQAEVWLVWYPLFPKATGLQIIDAGLNVYSEALKVFNADDIIFLVYQVEQALHKIYVCIFLKTT